MRQEEKDLLLRDLCCRLPYGVKVYGLYSPEGSFYSKWHNGKLICIDNTNSKEPSFCVEFESPVCSDGWCGIANIKPYLRPMSSMTDEESEEYTKTFDITSPEVDDYDVFQVRMVDWLIEHHFDVRGLIEKGLALEAPEDMYK